MIPYSDKEIDSLIEEAYTYQELGLVQDELNDCNFYRSREDYYKWRNKIRDKIKEMGLDSGRSR
jgi:hypothetical protein